MTIFEMNEKQYRENRDDSDELFDVWQTFVDGSQERVRQGVPAKEAVEAAAHYSRCVGARIGTTREVLIVDSGDMTVFHWVSGKGVIFPRPKPLPENTPS